MNVIIGIGYDGSDAPEQFYDSVVGIVNSHGVLDARIIGDTYSYGWGDERGAWIAATFPNFDKYAEARARILAVAAVHNQDAVAFTVGTVDVAETPATVEGRYRDFL